MFNKVSKKKFKDGLGSIFSGFKEDELLASTYTETETLEAPKAQKKKDKKRASTKSFSADLEALFKSSLTDTIVEQVEQATKDVKADQMQVVNKIGNKKKPIGLDALIRQTVETSKVEVAAPKTQKRVTFVFDKSKLLKLKSIAKLEKAYLKDIIGGLVSEYIDEYEEDKGDIDFNVTFKGPDKK